MSNPHAGNSDKADRSVPAPGQGALNVARIGACSGIEQERGGGHVGEGVGARGEGRTLGADNVTELLTTCKRLSFHHFSSN